MAAAATRAMQTGLMGTRTTELGMWVTTLQVRRIQVRETRAIGI